MAGQTWEPELQAVEDAVRSHPAGVTVGQIHEALESPTPRRTLQYRLKALVDSGRLAKVGAGRAVRYRPSSHPSASAGPARRAFTAPPAEANGAPPISEGGAAILDHVRQPPAARTPVGYNRAFLDAYRPNATFYLSGAERAQLGEVGQLDASMRLAGTYAKQLLSRLLIDLSWNSSRLEGNTYSLLDTQRLIEAGEEADGKPPIEAQMILNHKAAIEWLAYEPEAMGFSRFCVLNLHGMLAANLLPDPSAPGRLRRATVGIGGSVFHPLDVPQLVEECFDQALATASSIHDPFEQAFFAMVHLPYLQPFDDVNKRVSRLCANMPLIKANLSPLTFVDVPKDLYVYALLGVYELNRIELLRDLFIWAYGRSAARYAAVRQSLGEPDPFRLRHRAALGEVVGAAVRGPMDRTGAQRFVEEWAREHLHGEESERFRDVVEEELLSLHEGNVARYRITQSEFTAWEAVWNPNEYGKRTFGHD